jgi:hypothetical protein
MAKNAFTVFIPMSTDSVARKRIVFDFFDLLAAVAARGKTNGLGGRKLSRMAGWWAFEHSDGGKGFDGGYKSWARYALVVTFEFAKQHTNTNRAADATSHLFFAYLRSLSPEATGGVSGISQLPRSLQALLSQTEYPPETPELMLMPTRKVVMIVNTVSPTPFALLRRARNFEYRDDDDALSRFSAYDDPVQTLTEECRRVLSCISSTNQSSAPTNGAAVPAGAWSRFEDIGFSNIDTSLQSPGDLATTSNTNGMRGRANSAMDDMGRPTTPSWADFLSTGFPVDRSPTLLPPDQSLPLPLSEARGHSSQSHVRNGLQDQNLEPGELASINQFDLDETFWWVWMTSLAGEETSERKSVFGRCALIETQIQGARWLVVEEQIKGASPGQEEGVYIAEKKSRFSWTKRGRLSRKKTVKKPGPNSVAEEPFNRAATATPSKLGPEQHAKIQAAAAKLVSDGQKTGENGVRRSRMDESSTQKTNSMLTLQPAILSEAAPAMKWAKDFDRDAIRGQYLGDPAAGTGRSGNHLNASTSAVSLAHTNGASSFKREHSNRDLPALPHDEMAVTSPSPPATPPRDSIDEVTPEAAAATSFDEKPKLEGDAKHPALRSKTTQESSKAASSPETTPEKKTQKKEAGSGGLKKLFSRKRTSQSSVPVIPAKSPNVVVDTYQPQKLHKSPPKSIPIQVAYKEPTPEPSIANSSPAQSFKGQVTSPYDSAYVPRGYSEGQDASAVGSREQLAADAEFSRFDQGPMGDVPAFVPTDTPESSVAAISPPLHSNQFSRGAAPEHPMSEPPPVPTYKPTEPQTHVAPDNASEDSVEVAPPRAPMAADRWAQIRKNAAERAQRMSEEQGAGRSRSQSGNKTDDGETSGEETIESRVARIKARVAELTGTW